MARYEQLEYVDMIRVLHDCDENAFQAAQMYAQRFPDRPRMPNYNVFRRLQERILNNEPIVPVINIDNHRQRDVDREDQILDLFEREPDCSTRIASRRLNINHVFIHRTLRDNGLHPFHYTPVHHLHDQDAPRRRRFCRWFLREARDAQFHRNVLWTDEAIFKQDGVFNRHNQHIYATTNPRCVFERNSQRRFKLNVWCGMIDSYLVGPVFLPEVHNGDSYLELLNDLPQLLEDVPLNRRLNLIWQQDGAGFHRREDVVDCLDHMFPDGWIGMGSEYREWPARSPDLTPLDFFLWGYLKDRVYSVPIIDEDDLRDRIQTEAAAIPPEMIQRATSRTITVMNDCIEENGNYIEQRR